MKDPGASQLNVAKKVGISQSAIALRMEKLRSSELISSLVGLKLEKLGLKMGRVDLSTSDIGMLNTWAEKCPLFVNSSLGIGGPNVSLYILSEDMDMFQYIIEHHIRKLKGVSHLTFLPILTWLKPQYVPVSLDVDKRPSPPCGVFPYCPRCPANPLYDGKIWQNGHKVRSKNTKV